MTPILSLEDSNNLHTVILNLAVILTEIKITLTADLLLVEEEDLAILTVMVITILTEEQIIAVSPIMHLIRLRNFLQIKQTRPIVMMTVLTIYLIDYE